MNTSASQQPCKVCGRTAVRLFDKDSFAVWHCRACGFMSMSPDQGNGKHVDYASLYGPGYYNLGDSLHGGIVRYDLGGLLKTKRPQAQDAIRLIQRYRKTGRLLDVGCSVGVFVKVAQEAGFDAVGLDVSPMAVEFATSQLGVDARVGTLVSADLPHEGFEVITMWDVIEHFEDPWDMMNRIVTLLAPHGVLAVRTPNTQCLRTRLKGFRDWGMITPPEHYHLYARESLSIFLGRFGLRMLAQASIHSDWLYYRQLPAVATVPFRLSGALGFGGDLIAVAGKQS